MFGVIVMLCSIMAHKARSSWGGWTAVFSSDTLESEGAALHAVESWLCFHAGSWQGKYCISYQESFLVRFILSFHKYKTETVNAFLKENSNSVILNPLTYFAKTKSSE